MLVTREHDGVIVTTQELIGYHFGVPWGERRGVGCPAGGTTNTDVSCGVGAELGHQLV
jgi:hypothetical protein